MKTLQDCGRPFKRGEGVVDPSFPFRVWKIGPERDSAAAPTERRKTAYLQKKISISLAEFGRFAPIVNSQPWDDRMLWQWRGIEQPGVGNDLL